MQYPEVESNVLELKREIPKKDQIIKTMIGFCNTYGGKLILGVSDHLEIVGLEDAEIDQAMETIDKSIFDACSPAITPRIYTQRFGEKTVLIIEVAEGMSKPYFRRSDGIHSGVFVRLGRHTLRANQDMIDELVGQSKGVNYECTPLFQATRDDLNFSEITSFFKNRKNQGATALEDSMMRSYHLLVHDQSREYPSVLGMLLFGKNPQIYLSEAMIICTHFQGVSGREALAMVDCEGTLFQQFSQALNFLSERLYRSFSFEKKNKKDKDARNQDILKREEALEIPEIAIREALLNMIVHRSYALKAPSKIAIYEDRVEFFSPGQFPGPLNIKYLTSGITYLRNPGICKILRELSYIEKLGTGFIAIFNSYEKSNLKTPQIINGENYVKCILPREPQEVMLEIKDDLTRILELFKHQHELTVLDVVRLLAVSRPTAVRKLNQLLEKQVIERVGQTKNVRYQLRS